MAILLQMYFLGKYFSVTQEIFSNKTFGSFALGGIIYLALSFITIFPFIWIKPNIVYFSVILFTKDFFTTVFLIARREKLQGVNINFRAIGFMVISVIIIPILYEYVLLKFLHNDRNVAADEYSFWAHFKGAIGSLIYEQEGNKIHYINYIIRPIGGILIYSFVTSFYFNFSKRENYIDYFISLIMTLGLISIFSFQVDLGDMIGIFLMLFMTLISYNLIMFSRRRYGTLFGISVFVAWGIQQDLYWPMLILALATSLVYILLKKPKAFLFMVQLFSPLVVASTLWMVEISVLLAVTLAVLSGIAYISVFVFGRLKFMDQDTRLFHILNQIMIASVFIILIGCSIGLGMEKNIDLSIIYKGNNIFDTFGNNTYNIIQNVVYFIFVGVGCFFMLMWNENQSKIVKGKLLGTMLFFILATGFNPAFGTIMQATGHGLGFDLIQSIFTLPLLVWLVSVGRTKFMEIKK